MITVQYDVPVLVLFLSCTQLRVEPIGFVRIFKTIKIYLSMNSRARRGG